MKDASGADANVLRKKGETVTRQGAVRCGTEPGYQKHMRNHTDPCQPCKDAIAVYARERYAARVASTKTKGLPAGVAHGAHAYNQYGCRCQVCSVDRAQTRTDRTRT